MAGNESVLSMPTVPTPVNGLLYVVKDNEDYKVEIGVALGVAYLNSLGQIPDANVNLTWALIADKPTEFTPAAHVHDAADITTGTIDPARLPPLGAEVAWGDITDIPIFATRWPTWSEVTAKPATFTPSPHNHAASDITTGTFANARIASGNVTQHQADLSIAWTQVTGEPVYTTRWPSWTEVTSKPTSFTPSAHTHTWADISGEPVYATRWPTWTEVTSKPTFGTGAFANYASSSAANTLVLRDSSSDIQARLFRSEYDTTNSNIGFIMTQVDTASNNFIRPSTPLQVEAELGTTTATANRLAKRDGTGDLTAVDFNSTSDRRLKTKVENKMPRDLSNLLRFVSFVWIESEEDGLGLIAQEVQAVAPEYVSEDKDGILSIDKAGLTLEALLGLSAYVSSLEERLVELEDQVNGAA